MTKLAVPREILTQHIAVLGKTRSGKSSVMRGLVEDLLEQGKPVCIVDPKGDWWGIKLAKDGRHPGYPVVIFGGEHADVPINEHAGAHVAELFATGNRPCLIDLGGWMPDARTRFWIEFASTLFKHTKGDRWLAIDEVHNFCPKGRVFSPEAGKSIHWTNRLASEGLGKGLALICASQRPQKVHNDTLTSCETLIAMRVIHPSDREAIADWIAGCGDGSGAEVLKNVANLERGEGWVWSPEIEFGPQRVKFPMFRTYDSFKAQTAEDAKALTGWADVDLDEVRAKLDTVVKEAAANDPGELKKEIARLRGELFATKVEQAPAPAPTPALTDADRQALAQLGAQLQSLLTRLASFDQECLEQVTDAVNREMQRLRDTANDVAYGLSKRLEDAQFLITKIHGLSMATSRPLSAPTVPARDREAARRNAPAPPARVPITGITDNTPIQRPTSAGGLNGMQRALLTALAQHPNGLSKKKILVHADYRSSGKVSKSFAMLVRAGWVEGTGDNLKITPLGLRVLGPYTPLPQGRELLAQVLAGNKLSPAAKAMLRVLADVYPSDISKAEILARAQYAASGKISAAFAHLIAIDYAIPTGTARLKLADELA